MEAIEHVELKGNTTAPAAAAGIPIEDKPMLMGIKEYADKHPTAVKAVKTAGKFGLLIGAAVAISEAIDFFQAR